MATDAQDKLGELVPVLRHSRLCSGLEWDELLPVAEAVRTVVFHSGEVVCRHNEPGHSMFIVAQGRLKLSLEQGGAEYRLLEYLGRGEHFGELALLTDGRHAATATAVMDSTLLELDQESFHRLMIRVPGFAANLSRSLGFRLHGQSNGRTVRRKPKVIGLVNSTLRTQGLLHPLASALSERGDNVEVLTDRTDLWNTQNTYQVQHLPAEIPDSDKPGLLRSRLAYLVDRHDRVIVDVTQKGLETLLPGLLLQCEEAWWLIEPRYLEAGRKALETLLSAQPRLRDRLRIVWILEPDQLFGPPPLDDLGLQPPEFKVPLAEDPAHPHRNQALGISRLVRHLHGTRIGLALGGGGARGMAHLGVLRALDRAGIYFDLVSGTSCGALMGLSYVGGWEPQRALEEFNAALTPNWLLRHVPGGHHWYLWYMFRTGAWDRMLRPYLEETRIEQLQIPFFTVACDLISGQAVVRDRGDAINAVLESINFPPVARPILRDGMALIDGGVLNNVPADILPQHGADLIVGVDVTAQLRQRFARNTPATSTDQMRRPGVIETLWRVTEVQDYNISNLRTASLVDLMICPDTSGFDFVDFSQGLPLAEAGEAAAEEAIPQLRQMLEDLEEDG
jgi:predicted acylesterase/phospholipase RssA/CRP-like cAMP-binding protein